MLTKKELRAMSCKEIAKHCKKIGICGFGGKKKSEVIKMILERPIKYIDLFCGLGAFHEAFKRNSSKYECVFACDIDEGIRDLYYENYGIKPFGDINQIDGSQLPDFDILCAGFPCQPFSIAGKKQGFLDKNKGNLFYKILDIIDAKNPSTLILENVKNLQSIHNGETFKTIVRELETRGYKVSHKVLDSRYYNSPQSRQRIYIVCNKSKQIKFCDVKYDVVPVSSIIDYSDTDYFDYQDKYRLEKCSAKTGMMRYKLINKQTGKGGRQGERVYGIDSCGPTICASSGGPGSKTGLYEIECKKIRTLNVKETLQMFGFSIDYKYSSLKNPKKMLFYLGNSIVVNVLEEIIKDI